MKLSIILLLTLILSSASHSQTMKEAYFAGGCFWCMEAPFEEVSGVEAAVSGFAGGTEEAPTYEEVASGATGHRETVRITYDADIISYTELLEIFWRQIDPTDDGGQFVDRGFQYTTAIFYTSEEERLAAERSKKFYEDEERFTDPIVTPILPFTTFYRAEGDHQDYYKNHKFKYKHYRKRSGRDEYLKKIWD